MAAAKQIDQEKYKQFIIVTEKENQFCAWIIKRADGSTLEKSEEYSRSIEEAISDAKAFILRSPQKINYDAK